MKKLSILLLIGVVILCGCVQQKPELQNPVSFYYLPADFTFGVSDSVIVPEQREGNGISDLNAMLTLYFQGPVSSETRSPFPAGTRLLAVEQAGDTLCLTLNDSFASLQGHKLTLACAAITKTCLELTDCVNVQIQAENTTLEGEKFLIMNEASLLLLDNAESENH